MRGKTTFHIRWKLFFYDVIVFAVTSVFLLVLLHPINAVTNKIISIFFINSSISYFGKQPE